MIDAARPISRRLGPLVPYGACFAVVWGLIGFESHVRWGEAGGALALQVLVALGLWWRARWERVPPANWAGMAAFLVSVALLRDGVGKTVGGYGTLVLLPVVWAALRGRRGELALGVAGATVVQLAPLIVVGAPYYPGSGWRSGALLIVVAGVLGTTILTLVEQVQSSERLHRLLAENSSDLVLRASLGGEILYASPAARQLLGYDPDELIGGTIGDLTHPDDLPGVRDRLAQIDEQLHAGSVLARMRHRDGRLLWLEASIRSIRDRDGTVVERQSALRDVTDRVQRDSEQRALSQIATTVASGVDPSAVDPMRVLDTVAERLASLSEAIAGAVVRFDPAAGEGAIVGAWASPGHDILDLRRPVDLTGQSAAAHVYRTGSTVRLENYLGDPERPVLSETLITGAVGAPVIVAGNLWGAVGAAFAGTLVPPGLELRLERFAELVSLAISNAEMVEELARDASTDPLTGLANHRVFHERLREEMQRARRYEHSMTVALFDIDHFKRVNDEHGHQTGDHVLVEIARRVSRQARAGELVARIGGEELAWLMPEASQADGHAAAERARQAVAASPFPGVGSITMSAGVCCAGDGVDAEELMRCADEALYEAKEAGRNRTVAYTGAGTQRP